MTKRFDENSISKRIKAMITDNNVFDALANSTVGVDTLTKIINGEKSPTVEQLALISKALGVTSDYLLFGTQVEDNEHNTKIDTPAALAEAIEEMQENDLIPLIEIPKPLVNALLKMTNIETVDDAVKTTEISIRDLNWANKITEACVDKGAKRTLWCMRDTWNLEC